MAQTDIVAPEFSYIVDLSSLPQAGKHYHLKAASGDCDRIAQRLGVIAVLQLEGDIDIRANKSTINVAGTMRSELTRECVASLEEMNETVADSFELEFFRDADAINADDDPEAAALAEIHEDGDFDIGELLVQQLSLIMNPFPRKEDAPSLVAAFGEDIDPSPFAELQPLLKKND